MGNPQVILRLPEKLAGPLVDDAEKQNCSLQTVILKILADHYRIEVPPPERGRPANSKTRKV